MPLLLLTLIPILTSAAYIVLPKLLMWLGITFASYYGISTVLGHFEDLIFSKLSELSSITQNNILNVQEVIKYVGVYDSLSMIFAAYTTAFAWKAYGLLAKYQLGV
jgi:hypothetical protein